MWKIIDKLIKVITIINIFTLLIVYSSPYIDPNKFVIPSLLEPLYFYFFIANILFLIYWICKFKKISLYAAIALLLGYPSLKNHIVFDTQEVSEYKHSVNIMSYNVRYFNAYNWSKDKNTKEKLLKYLQTYDGDVICLQEYSLKSNSPEENKITQILSHKYPYSFVRNNTAIFSKLPVIDKGICQFSDRKLSPALYCDISKNKDTIRIFNTHLVSYKFSEKEYSFIRKIKDEIKSIYFKDKAYSFLNRITTAHKNRAKQAQELHQYISESPHPVILCGDFNSTPISYTYKKIKTGMNDAFLESGEGLGCTYISKFPSFRIDYILHSKKLSAISFRKDKIKYSDHYPIYCCIALK